MANLSDFSKQAVKVRRVLASYDPFRHASDFVAVQPGPQGVEIYGAVRTETIARSALHWVGANLGDVPLVNHLVADNVLEADVAQALASDPRTRAAHLRVGAYLGQVAVIGAAPMVDREVVLEIVQGITGVRQVDTSSLALPPDAQPVATMAATMVR